MSIHIDAANITNDMEWLFTARQGEYHALHGFKEGISKHTEAWSEWLCLTAPQLEIEGRVIPPDEISQVCFSNDGRTAVITTGGCIIDGLKFHQHVFYCVYENGVWRQIAYNGYRGMWLGSTYLRADGTVLLLYLTKDERGEPLGDARSYIAIYQLHPEFGFREQAVVTYGDAAHVQFSNSPPPEPRQQFFTDLSPSTVLGLPQNRLLNLLHSNSYSTF